MNRQLKVRHGFTLIELLVVITIIVVLLALLTPALEKAVYQAQLAVCGAHQEGIVNGGMMYAVGNKRVYASNFDRRSSSAGYAPLIIGIGRDPTRDLRPVVRDYLSLKSLLCPLSPEVDLSPEANDASSLIYASYEILMGWQYTGSFGGKGMFRVGDRLEFLDTWDNNRPISTNVIVGDSNRLDSPDRGKVWGLAVTSHPDADGVLKADAFQNYDPVGGIVNPALDGQDLGGALGRQTQSGWSGGANGSPRGALDLNFGFDDGSVERYNGLKPGDSRLRPAPNHAASTIADFAKRHMPGKE